MLEPLALAFNELVLGGSADEFTRVAMTMHTTGPSFAC